MLCLQNVSIVISIIHFLFEDVMEDLYNYVNPLNKRHSPMIAKETLDIVIENKAVSVHKVSRFIHQNGIIAIMCFICFVFCSASTLPSYTTETSPITSLDLR